MKIRYVAWRMWLHTLLRTGVAALRQGRLLRALSIPWALAASPLIAALVLSAAAVHPSLPVIASAEVLRMALDHHRRHR